MNKKTIITILLALVVMSGQGQVRCQVIGTVSDETTPVELVIYRDGEAPKNSMLRPVLKDGHDALQCRGIATGTTAEDDGQSIAMHPQCPEFQKSERKTVNVSLDFENQNYKCYYFVSKTDMDIVIILIPL